MEKILKGKKILITAGSTWVPIDSVRVITNIFGGNLGFIIAKTAFGMGAAVTLLIGPNRVNLPSSTKKFKITKFKYFQDLLKLVKKEVGSKQYDAVIHSAAVSDYAPIFATNEKIKSGKKNLVIRLKPTIKIVDLIKKIDPGIFLVKFKLEVGVSEKKLINIAYESMLDSRADLMVANDFKRMNKGHDAFIINKDKKIVKCVGKKELAKKLLYIIKNLI